jgi:hypothetical protein
MIRGFEETVVGNPPEGWTLGHVTLDLHYPEERVPVEAWRHGPFAVHERTGSEGKEAVLTHVPTGRRVNSFATMDEAVECAETIEPFTDWDAIKQQMPPGSDLCPKVQKIVDEIKKRPSVVLSAHLGTDIIRDGWPDPVVPPAHRRTPEGNE